MENGLAFSVTSFAEILQALFVWSIVVLALGRVFEPLNANNWRTWLRRCLLVGVCSGILGVVAIALSVSDQFAYKEEVERYAVINRLTGPYAYAFWSRPLGLVVMSVLLIFARKCNSWWIAWLVAFLLSIAAERLVIVITSLHRDYLPSSWTLLTAGSHYLMTPFALLVSAVLVLWAQRRGRIAKEEMA